MPCRETGAGGTACPCQNGCAYLHDKRDRYIAFIVQHAGVTPMAIATMTPAQLGAQFPRSGIFSVFHDGSEFKCAAANCIDATGAHHPIYVHAEESEGQKLPPRRSTDPVVREWLSSVASAAEPGPSDL